MADLQYLLERTEMLLARIEQRFPTLPLPPDWEKVTAFRWRKQGQYGVFQAVHHPHRIRLRDLRGIDTQKQQIDRNTRQFLQGKPANNVLLWGTRGTGKSSLIKALLNEYAGQGLRLIEVEKHDLIDLPDIVDHFYQRPEYFIVFCDDLSFERDDSSYKALKSVLDGAISTTPENVLIYATSNRRHLLPEYQQENLETQHVNGEIHHSEAVEEKISLSERFGLWLAFYPFSQEEYLAIVHYWLQELGIFLTAAETAEMQHAALQWARLRGSQSGRAARQFVSDWIGRRTFE